MRIGIDARLWNETGVGRYIRNLVSELAKIDKENQYSLFLREKEFNEIELPGNNWEKRLADIRWHSFKEQWEMPKILNKEKLDLVHFPYFNIPIFYDGPFVVTIHDLIINHFPTGRATTLPWPLYQVKRLGYKLLVWWAVKKSQKIIAVSESTKREIVDHFKVNPDKIIVTYESGILEIKKAGIMRSEFKKPYILYVGNAHPHKNLERLIDAFSKFNYSDIRLVLVGKEDYFYRRLKKKVAEVNSSDKVVFYGEADDDNLRDLYKNAAALVLPSLMEGFGLPALEAMGQGCLVLCSNIPAFREICADAAIYFDPTSVEDMAQKIEEVIRNKNADKYRELIEKGRKRTQLFSWQKMAQETLEVYQHSIY